MDINFDNKKSKETDLSLVIYQKRPECEHYIDMWKNYDCVDCDWIKNKKLLKHQHCTQIFNKYLECVINHSHK